MRRPLGVPPHDVTPLMSGAVIQRTTGQALLWLFLGLIALPLAYQLAGRPARERERWCSLFRPAWDWAHTRSPLDFLPPAPSRQQLKGLTDEVARDSPVAAAVRRTYQCLLTGLLNEGSQKVVIGRDDWLFLREDVMLCTGTAIHNASDDPLERRASVQEPVSIPPIIEFDRQLRDHGIHLIVVPVPVGPVLYPEQLWAAYPADLGPAWNEDYLDWRRRLAQAGVDVMDVTADLWRVKAQGPRPWLPNNTHWSPRGVAIAAGRIAEHVRPHLRGERRVSLMTRTLSHPIRSDLAPLLDLPRGQRFPPIECALTQVRQSDGQLASGGPDAPVMLLGDSYSYIFNGRDADDADGADLGRELMLELNIPVQVVALKAIDPTLSRAALGLLTPSLPAKQVIVWEFTTRFLQDKNKWKSVPFPPLPRSMPQRR